MTGGVAPKNDTICNAVRRFSYFLQKVTDSESMSIAFLSHIYLYVYIISNYLFHIRRDIVRRF